MDNSVSGFNVIRNKNQNYCSDKKDVFKHFNSFFVVQNEIPKQNQLAVAKKNLDAAKKQNGLIEKLADFIKDKTGFGLSYKLIEKDIDEGKISENEINNNIKNYRRSQENTAQAAADVVSCSSSVAAFFAVKQFAELNAAKLLRIKNGDLSDFFADFKWFKKLENACNKKSSFIILGTIAAALTGSLVKSLVLKLNRIGTSQYKPEINEGMDKAQRKQAKKAAGKEKRRANFRNAISGAVNGLTVPLLSFMGVWGAPFYLLFNSVNRYFIGSREDRESKNINSYIDNFKTSSVMNALSLALILIPALKKAKYNKIFEKNLSTAVDKLNSTRLTIKLSTQSSYEQLENIMFSNDTVKRIVSDYSINIPEKIKLLSDENIFALKFKQITANFDDLSRALKTDCPPTRTIAEAQKYVEETFGSKYKIEKLLGVGTVAETYLAKDKSGKELCIKMLKNGITEDKILKDKTAFIQMVQNLQGKSDKEKEFLIKNIENIADGVVKEVNFTNEMQKAQELAKVTKKAKLVKPIGVKNNIYLMEKADGISLQNLLKEIENGSIDISKEESKKLIELYQDVLIEQFNKVNKNGKIIHGDIHPGNIFIDLNALKSGKKDCFTLIDTGNTILQSPESAMRFIYLSKYIKDADIENITKFALDGAVLPEGMTSEKAYSEVSKQLSKAFFDTETQIGHINNDNVLGIMESIMRNLNIIPSDTQGNLMKAKKSAKLSLQGFVESFFGAIEKDMKDMGSGKDKTKLIIGLSKLVKDGTAMLGKYYAKIKLQERKNLALLSPIDRVKIKRSPSAPAKNSLDYLIYALKQYKKD